MAELETLDFPEVRSTELGVWLQETNSKLTVCVCVRGSLFNPGDRLSQAQR